MSGETDGGGNAAIAGLMQEAAALDAELGAQTPEARAEAQAAELVGTLAEENVRGVGMILALAVPVLSKLYPSIEAVYTDEACGEVAAALGPVLAKYNVNLKDFGGRWQEEIGAAIVCGPIAWATVQAIKADIAARVGNSPQAVGHAKAAALSAPGPQPQPGDYGYVEPAASAAGMPGV
jgi:hypothetical protein